MNFRIALILFILCVESTYLIKFLFYRQRDGKEKNYNGK